MGLFCNHTYTVVADKPWPWPIEGATPKKAACSKCHKTIDITLMYTK